MVTVAAFGPVVVQSIGRGVEVTLAGTILSAAVGLAAAFLAGLARLSSTDLVRVISSIYVEVFRGASTIVLLFWAFYVLPSLGLKYPAFTVGFVILGLNSGAYASEVVRGAILGIPKEQREAGIALGMSNTLIMWKVILPQAVPTMIPPFGNVLIDILKGTSLFSLITITDLSHAVNELTIIGALKLVPAYSFLLIMYFLLSLPFVAIIRAAEHLAGRRLPSKVEARGH